MNTEQQQPRRSGFPWRTLIFFATIIVLCSFVLIAFFKACQSSSEVAAKAKEAAQAFANQLPDAAAKFRTGTITQTFTESIPEINSTKGDILELATSRSDEIFRREDSKSVLWDWVYLGTTVSEIRVPVTFRYHLRLSDSWRLAAKDQVCLVLAPPIRPSLPPAIHTDRMEKSTENGWARFNANDNLTELERSLTPILEQRAADAQHMRLVREACRQSVAEFVKRWLMKEDRWRNDRFTSIVVLFSDEASIPSDKELEQYQYEPTIRSAEGKMQNAE